MYKIWLLLCLQSSILFGAGDRNIFAILNDLPSPHELNATTFYKEVLETDAEILNRHRTRGISISRHYLASFLAIYYIDIFSTHAAATTGGKAVGHFNEDWHRAFENTEASMRTINENMRTYSANQVNTVYEEYKKALEQIWMKVEDTVLISTLSDFRG